MKTQYDIVSLGMMFVVISFLGFVLENAWLALTKGFIDNRSMHLPFLFGYGAGVLLIFLLIGTPERIVLFGRYRMKQLGSRFYFICTFFFISIGEILLGMFVEHVFHFSYWNYEWIPFHLTRYTSLPTSLGFAAILTGFMQESFPKGMAFFASIPPIYLQGVLAVTLTAMVADLLVSFKKMYALHGLNQRWKLQIGKWNEHKRFELIQY